MITKEASLNWFYYIQGPTASMFNYLVGWVMQKFLIADPNVAIGKLIQDTVKYTNIHHKLFGKYENTVSL